MKRSGPIKRVSSKQAKKNRTWSQLKLARIKASINSEGFVCCEGCKMLFFDVKSAQEGLEAHHKVQRSLCGGDTDENMALLCSGPVSCHGDAHSAEGLRAARLSSSL